MNLINVGVSYRTASVDLLEKLVVSPDDAPQMLIDLVSRPYVSEAMVLSTCNRVEVFAAVTAFHGGLADIGEVVAGRAGLTAAELADHMYVNFDTDAVRHAFRMATGLDSMVVGEPQILGQLRDAYALATERDTAGRLIHELMQQALRVGKRAHAETAIDHAGRNVVEVALRLAGEALAGSSQTGEAPAATSETGDALAAPSPASEAAAHAGGPRIQGRSALVIGAGATGGLALATLRRHGAGALFVANRDPRRAERQAELHGATPVPLSDLANAVDRVDLVICATAAEGHILTTDHVRGPVVILDLAVPRDVDPAVAERPGVTLIDIERLAQATETRPAGSAHAVIASRPGSSRAEDEVAAIVQDEVAAFRLQLRGAEVAPTVAALRSRADDVVAVEMRRLNQRRPDLSDDQRADVARTIHRVVQQLLHQPSVRIRELAAEPGGDRYAEALRDLFGLEIPPAVETVGEIPADVTVSEIPPDVTLGDGGAGDGS